MILKSLCLAISCCSPIALLPFVPDRPDSVPGKPKPSSFWLAASLLTCWWKFRYVQNWRQHWWVDASSTAAAFPVWDRSGHSAVVTHSSGLLVPWCCCSLSLHPPNAPVSPALHAGGHPFGLSCSSKPNRWWWVPEQNCSGTLPGYDLKVSMSRRPLSIGCLGASPLLLVAKRLSMGQLWPDSLVGHAMVHY